MVVSFYVVLIFLFLKLIYHFGIFSPIERIWSSGNTDGCKELTVPLQVASH